jgi:hypothetical protein
MQVRSRAPLVDFSMNRWRTIAPNIDATFSETRCSLESPQPACGSNGADASPWHGSDHSSRLVVLAPPHPRFRSDTRPGHRSMPSQNARLALARRLIRPRGQPDRRGRLRHELAGRGKLAKTSRPVSSNTSEGGTLIACTRLRVPLPSARVTRTKFDAVLIRFEEAVAVKDLPAVEARATGTHRTKGHTAWCAPSFVPNPCCGPRQHRDFPHPPQARIRSGCDHQTDRLLNSRPVRAPHSAMVSSSTRYRSSRTGSPMRSSRTTSSAFTPRTPKITINKAAMLKSADTAKMASNE